MNSEVSKYMREMQRRSAEARWSGLSAEDKRAKMSALAKARWAKTKRKPKRVARRSNNDYCHADALSVRSPIDSMKQA